MKDKSNDQQCDENRDNNNENNANGQWNNCENEDPYADLSQRYFTRC